MSRNLTPGDREDIIFGAQYRAMKPGPFAEAFKRIFNDIFKLDRTTEMKMVTRPFNLEHAKAGAPFCCKDGMHARIYQFFDAVLIGLTTNPDGSHPACAQWDLTGACTQSRQGFLASESDLVMIPLGYVEGKPVFVGDEVRDRWNNSITAYIGMGFDPAHWFWPAPEADSPKTSMAGGELFDVYAAHLRTKHGYNSITAESTGLAEVANAAIARAIQDGDVVAARDVALTAKNPQATYVKIKNGVVFPTIDGVDYVPSEMLGKSVLATINSCEAIYKKVASRRNHVMPNIAWEVDVCAVVERVKGGAA